VGANPCVRPDPGTRSRPIDRPGQTHGSAPTVFLTHPSDSAIATLMKHASTFLYPSWYEGFGIPLHEAARFGTPCISSTASALPETAPAGTIFADPAKPHHWAEGLKMILKSPTQYKTQTPLEDWVQAAAMVKEKMENLEVAQP
ncbi:glycosyltransferase, partial [Candidatus Uhrbacteria bacterium]|nr:glycosyltransferase [Candidatus Uhrbacteria bacterium]